MAHRATGLRYEDLEAFPEDNTRREIIDGELYVSPSPALRHQEIIASLWAILRAYAQGNNGKVYVGPVDVILAEHVEIFSDTMDAATLPGLHVAITELAD
jgi:hypothetical protein